MEEIVNQQSNIAELKDIINIILFVFNIVFFIVVGTVTVLTYKSARRGLLNTVNTEYQKRVMDKLSAVSEELYSEFDNSSDNYWAKKRDALEIADIIINKYKEEGKSIGIPTSTNLMKVEAILDKLKSDPFIPNEISDILIKHLDKRVNTMRKIITSESENFKNELFEGKYDENLDTIKYAFSNKVNEELYENGCGISQIEEEVHQIRLEIRKYLQSFNPFDKRISK
ncbi:MAG: hypothetical protein JJT76_19220 [Clostridiaceae bacterium]|nr:hypothetical protein [Clostridiaceae bacterium]